MRFKKQVVVVTGGARGLGEAFARRFASEGADIVLIDLHRDACEHTTQALQQMYGVQAQAVCVSVSDHDAMIRTVQQLKEQWGHIDIWVNNAGIYRGTPTEEVSMAEWQLMLDVNYTGVFVCTKAVSPVMKAQQRGRIINISSIAGRTGFRNSISYCSNKAAVIGLTRAVAIDLAPYNVTVNAVCPGTIMTDMQLKVDADICLNEGWPVGTHLQHKTAQIPMGRMGTIEEVAGVVAFLASNDASYVTGQTIEVDGGEIVV